MKGYLCWPAYIVTLCMHLKLSNKAHPFKISQFGVSIIVPKDQWERWMWIFFLRSFFSKETIFCWPQKCKKIVKVLKWIFNMIIVIKMNKLLINKALCSIKQNMNIQHYFTTIYPRKWKCRTFIDFALT